MLKEIGIGAALAAIVFALVQGFDITPFLLMGGVLAMLFFLSSGRMAPGQKFETVGAGGQRATSTSVTFDDIGGQEVAKREFTEALEFMKDAEKVKQLGIRPLKGILLSGPPGTGKTLLAKAAANFTDAAFVAASGSQFVEMYAGVGAQRVRQIFKKVREAATRQGRKNGVVFIDEIDVLGGRRGQNSTHMEYDQTLNQLLTEMDGIQQDDDVRVLVVAATNRADLLDPALLRPGRFDRTVRVDLPDREGRLHILRIHTRGKPVDPGVDLDQVAKECFGFSGAHLESLVNEAAILAMRADRTTIVSDDFKEAIDKVMMGEKLDRKPIKPELERVAYHEVGHAIASELVRPGSVSAVTITSRGQALGYMRQAPSDDRYMYTALELKGQIAVCMGGAASEQLIYNERSTGASGDFEEAVRLAKRLVFSGLSDLGVVSKDDLGQQALHDEIHKLIREQERRVQRWLSERRQVIEQAQRVLMERERITGDELRTLLGRAASAHDETDLGAGADATCTNDDARAEPGLRAS